jgi:hypothetical protein
MLMTGLRGVGKTVLLIEIGKLGKSAGGKAIAIEAHEDMPLGPLLVPHLKTALYELDVIAGAGNKVKRGLAVLRSFIGALKVEAGDVTFGLDIEPARGSADSGNLQVDLPNLFAAVGEAAQERKCFLLMLIDELQYLSKEELGALIMAMHKVQQLQLPVALVGAGLPTLPGLAGDAKSYAERLFEYPVVGALSPEDSAKALRDPARAEGADFQAKALAEIVKQTRGYPYFLQVWGYECWNAAARSPITLKVAHATTPAILRRLDEGFFRVRFERLSPGEKTFLRAIAELGDGAHPIGKVAALRNTDVRALSTIRSRLIKSGMIYSPAHGEIAFTVPMFDQFMKRAIP